MSLSLPAPRILIVDDQRDVSRMLRTALETLGHGYVIVDVPSAEEAQLEFRRGPFDLLITDLRLPGISGLELIRRLHKASTEAAMIVISVYADETDQAEFRRLGATFFAKPLALDAFLQSVQDALGSRPATGDQARDEESGIADRLARLQRDLGALAVLLVARNGQIAVRSGDADKLDLGALLTPLSATFSASLQVSQALGGRVPANVHFFDGNAYDVYSADVGLNFALVILFDGARGAGQMGLVLRYGRQCADDLLNALRAMGGEAGKFPQPGTTASAPQANAGAQPKTAPRAAVAAPSNIPEAKAPPGLSTRGAGPPLRPEDLLAIDAAAQNITSQTAASFWDKVDGTEIDDERSDIMSWEQAAKLGLLPPPP
jgi:CheY-like chemotaxis protein